MVTMVRIVMVRIGIAICILRNRAFAFNNISLPIATATTVTAEYCGAAGDKCECNGFVIQNRGTSWSSWQQVLESVVCTGSSSNVYCLCQKSYKPRLFSQSSFETLGHLGDPRTSLGSDYRLDTWSETAVGIAGELNPWWQVDLGRNLRIGTIRYRNRDDDCASRLLGGYECDWRHLSQNQGFKNQGGATFGVSTTSQGRPCNTYQCLGTICDRITAENVFANPNQSPWYELNGCSGRWARYAYVVLNGRNRVLNVVEMHVLKEGSVKVPAGRGVSPADAPAIEEESENFFQNIIGGIFGQWWFWIACCCLCVCLRQCAVSGKKSEGEQKTPSAYDRIVTALGLRGRTAIPIYWENSDKDLQEALDRESDQFFDEMYPVSPEVHESLEQLLNNTSLARTDLPGLTIVRAIRIEDAIMWASYQQCAAEIQENRGTCEFKGEGAPVTMQTIEGLDNSTDFSHTLEPELCEAYLWHATNPEAAMKIAEDGFRVDLSGAGRFGRGAYFAEDAGKSDSYAKPGKGLYANTYAMLLCRCVLGEQRLTTQTSESIAQEASYDSTLAEPPGQAREFIVYNNEQVYPEYAIVYERRDPNERDENAYWDNPESEAIKDSLPTYWRNNSDTVGYRLNPRFDEMYPAHTMKSIIQKMADDTWRMRWTRDRKGSDGQRIPMGDPNGDMPEGIRILKALRVEDSEMWKAYIAYQEEIRNRRGEECASLDYEDVRTTAAMGSQRRRLAGDVNEVYLWHGSSPHAVSAIAEDGFKVDTTKTGLFFGQGAYFAECASKADEYSQDESDGYYKGYYAMLLCRVTMGEVQVLLQADPHAHTRVGPGHEFDSTLGDRETAVGTYREFVVPTSLAVYPEYAIIYERQYAKKRVRSLRVPERHEVARARPLYGVDYHTGGDDAEE